MNGILLTQNTTPIFRYVVWILGKIMEGIFFVLDKVGIPNIGLSIIFFTIVINLILLPITIKQQKFSKLSAKMQPEITEIRKKYENKKDSNSQMAMNTEIQALYAKYGVSPTGSCAYLLIQMPILFALYRVIYQMPAYVAQIGNTFGVLADKIISDDKAAFLQNAVDENGEAVGEISKAVAMYSKNLAAEGNLKNGVIDVLNKLSTSDMHFISKHYGLSELQYNGSRILSTITENSDGTLTVVKRGLIDTYNNFLGLNIGNSPWYTIKEAFSAHNYLLIVGAAMIPILAALTQWINVKLMPQQNNDNSGDEQAQAMANSMKTMNTFMPLMSAYFCFTLPSGMGLYWVAGAIVRSIQQVVINKHIDKIDFDKLIEKNAKKSAKKIEKQKAQAERMAAYASVNTKSIQSRVNNYNNKAEDSSQNNTSQAGSTNSAAPGSIAARANMVRDYNNKNK